VPQVSVVSRRPAYQANCRRPRLRRNRQQCPQCRKGPRVTKRHLSAVYTDISLDAYLQVNSARQTGPNPMLAPPRVLLPMLQTVAAGSFVVP
jgi:hypothetical protein